MSRAKNSKYESMSLEELKANVEKSRQELEAAIHNKNLLEQRKKLVERRERSHRLIVKGAEFEKAFPLSRDLEQEEFQEVMNQMRNSSYNNYLQTHQIETMNDLQERIEELNGVVSVSKKEISEKRKQLKELENLEKMAEVIKTNQPLIDEYNHFFFQKKREKYYQQHKKEINYYRKCERELKQHLDQNGKVPTARWKREKEELQAVIEELKADNQPYQEELAFVKKVQSCADIARRDREMAEADTSGRSEEKMEEQKPEKKTSLLRKLDEKKKECAERDAKQQAVKKKRNYEMSL